MTWNKVPLRLIRPHLVTDKTAPIGFPAFAPIVSDAFDHLKDLPEVAHFEACRTLIKQGTNVEFVYLLRSGLVKLTYVTPDGHQTTLGLRSSGSCLGAVWALMNTPSVYSVTTLTQCSMSRVETADFPMKLMQNAKFMRHFLGTLCNESMSQAAAQAQVMACSAEARLKHFMRERETEHFGVKTLDTLPVLKQMELAQLLSVTPEHLSRLMHKLSVDQKLGDEGMDEMTA